MEIIPTSNYYRYLSSNERYYYLSRVLAPLIALTLGLIVIVYIREKCILTFTNSMRIANDQLVVCYMKFFRNREAAFPLTDTVLELREYHDDTHHPPYHQLAIRYRNKIKYTLDSREGYTKELLLSFMGSFASAQLSTALHQS